MRTARIFCFWVISCVIVAGLLSFGLAVYVPMYSAEALIGVLPAAAGDPFTSEPAAEIPAVSYGQRVTMATLMKSQTNLQVLLENQKVRETEWFQGQGTNTDECIKRAVRHLQRHLRVHPQRRGNLLVVSMTCPYQSDAAVIVNGMVESFLRERGIKEKEHIASRLGRLEEQRARIQRDLDSAEDAMDDVRRRYGFSDLGQHPYRDAMTERLICLGEQRDECAIKIKELQGRIDFAAQQPQTSEPTEAGQSALVELRRSLAGMQAAMAEVEKMREEAAEQKREIDVARVQYAQRAVIRDERARALDAVKAQLERLRILHDDLEAAGLRYLGGASEPLLPDGPKWRLYLPGGVIVGLMLALLHCSSRPARRQKKSK